MDGERDILPEPFSHRETSLESIKESGWFVDTSMSGNWWFRKKETMERQPVPFWIRQMVHDAYENGQERARAEMRHALGVTGKQGKRPKVIMFESVP